MPVLVVVEVIAIRRPFQDSHFVTYFQLGTPLRCVLYVLT